MILDYFVFVFRNLARRKLRTWLTLLGIFIGMTAVVALISLSQGMQTAINQQFQKVGSNRIIISPGSSDTSFGGQFSAIKLTEDDVNVVKKVKGIEFATGTLTSVGFVTFKGETKRGILVGMDSDQKTAKFVEEVGLFDIAKGRNPKKDEKGVVVLGYDVANRKFRKKIKVGDKIIIKDKEFKVIGIQEKIGTGIHDRVVRMPKKELKNLLGITNDEVSTIFARVIPTEDTEEVAERVKKALRKSRHVEEGSEDFNVQTAKQVIEAFTNILLIIQIMLVGVASISLLVGGVGIMNTMYTSVLERVREIGVMKAVGARNLDILVMFVFESGLLGLVGGVIGVILGLIISKTAEVIAYMLLNSKILVISLSWQLLVGVLAFSFLIGALSGLIPAMQASKLKPVEALRYE